MNCIAGVAVFVVEVVAVLEVDMAVTVHHNDFGVSFHNRHKTLNFCIVLLKSTAVVRSKLVVACTVAADKCVLVNDNLVTIILVLV